ncbi:MAG TPA: glycosyltransferase family 2 protein, partial [Patescibacteria group bacterium]|nr:glycosyltransferase family 2 protein [Patescibacteria group bacterium]
MPEQFDVSLILCCLNEAEHFTKSVDRIIEVLDGTDFSWEILFIDDKSRDETPLLIKNYIAGHRRQHLSGYFHQINRGRGATVAEGIEKSQGKIVGYIDIDLEVLPDYIPRFVQAVENGFDVAAGWRIYDFTLRSLPRWFASKGYNFVRDRVLGTTIKDTEAGYKFFRKKKILPIFKKCVSPGWFRDTEIMVQSEKAGLKISQIPV